MNKTKYENLEKSDQIKKLPQPLLEIRAAKEGVIHDLPDPLKVKVNKVDLFDVINSRVTTSSWRISHNFFF